MRILILGATGMLGHKLVQTLSPRYDVVGTVRHRVPSLLEDFSILRGVQAENFSSIINAFAQFKPDVVLNCIGLIKQLKPSRGELVEINSSFPHRLLSLCQASGCRLVHFSTDCVFSGRDGNYNESSQPDPVDDYGFSKLLGELPTGGLTIRSSIVGRELSGGHGLFEWFYGQRGQSTRGFQKAIYSGLTTLEMSRVVAAVIENHPTLEGVWQVSSEPISKFELLQKLNHAASLAVNLEADNSFSCDRSLDSTRFRNATGYRPPSWDVMVEEFVKDGEIYDVRR